MIMMMIYICVWRGVYPLCVSMYTYVDINIFFIGHKGFNEHVTTLASCQCIYGFACVWLVRLFSMLI